jgi:SPX domain protein involved in polyphosphate accumulation
MKYGTELQKRSVPQWRAHNIDYNEIKDLIKQATLPDAPSDILDRLVTALLQEYESVSAQSLLHIIRYDTNSSAVPGKEA